MPHTNHNSKLIALSKVRAIAYNPLLARLAGDSATTALFMCQLLFWYSKGWDKEWTYKTAKEFKEETSLTRSEQDRAIRTWKELGVLEVKKVGIPQTRHFKVDVNKLTLMVLELAAKFPNLTQKNVENNKLNYRNRQNTTESTSEISPRKTSKMNFAHIFDGFSKAD